MPDKEMLCKSRLKRLHSTAGSLDESGSEF